MKRPRPWEESAGRIQKSKRLWEGIVYGRLKKELLAGREVKLIKGGARTGKQRPFGVLFRDSTKEKHVEGLDRKSLKKGLCL